MGVPTVPEIVGDGDNGVVRVAMGGTDRRWLARTEGDVFDKERSWSTSSSETSDARRTLLDCFPYADFKGKG